MDQYKRPSILAAQMYKLKVFLADGEKCCKKVYEDVVEACREFEADHKDLQLRKDDGASSLKALKKVVVAREGSVVLSQPCYHHRPGVPVAGNS